MKTNRIARRIVRIRLSVALLAVCTILGLEVGLGASIATRFGQTTGSHSEVQVPDVNLGALFNGAR